MVSQVGDRALGVALSFFVFRETDSVTATALLALAVYLPGLLFGSFAGVLADRWERRRVLVVSQLLQGSVMLLLLLATRPGWLWVAYAVTFAELTLSLVALPAGAARLPSLVGEKRLGRANATLVVGTTVARLLGPPLGGVLVTWGGVDGVVVFDAVTFFGAALCFTRPPRGPVAPAEPVDGRVVAGDGRRVARRPGHGGDLHPLPVRHQGRPRPPRLRGGQVGVQPAASDWVTSSAASQSAATPIWCCGICSASTRSPPPATTAPWTTASTRACRSGVCR